MKTSVLFLMAVLVSTSSANAQMQCRAELEPAALRAESTAELIGDIVIRCTGGTPASSGNPLPAYELLLTAGGEFSNRVPAGQAAAGWTDALLLVDDPDTFNQNLCTQAFTGGLCRLIAGSGGANIFPGRLLQKNLLGFQNIPIDAPGAGKTRVLRIANIRMDARSAGGAPLYVSVQMFNNGRMMPLEGSGIRSGAAQASLEFSVRGANNAPVNSSSPALVVRPNSLPFYTAKDAPVFQAQFREAAPAALRRRNAGTSGLDPLFISAQAMPGLSYGTETGFANPGLQLESVGGGLPDSGTRLRLSFKDVPKNVALWVSVRDVPAGTSSYLADSPKVILTESDYRGVGPFRPLSGGTTGFAPIGVSADGYATAVWEVVSADPESIDEISVAIAVSGKEGAPALGTASVFASLAPNYEGRPKPPEIASLPSFSGISPVRLAFTIASSSGPQLSVLSGASFAPVIAPGSIASAFGPGLALVTAVPEGTLPTTLGDTSVDIIDVAGNRRLAPLFAVTPGQINFLVDPDTRPGPAIVNITRGGRIVASGNTNVEMVAPALFSADGSGSGPALGEYLQIGSADRSGALAAWNAEKGQWSANPVTIGGAGDLTYLVLYGTGIRNRSALSAITANVAGQTIPVLFAGAHPGYTGLDQINIGPLPAGLAGKGDTHISLQVSGKESNRLFLRLQ